MQTDLSVHNGDASGSAVTAQPLVPQRNRLQWEQEWLTQNNKAFAVIEANQSSTRSATTANTAAPAHLNRIIGYTPNVQAPQESVTKVAPGFDAAQTTIQLLQPAATVQRRLEPYALSAAVMEPNAPLNSDAAASAPDTWLLSATERRRTLRSFAWWKNGADVSVAMRLTSESEQSDIVVRTLRQWLKEAGMNLLSVVVNGKIKTQ